MISLGHAGLLAIGAYASALLAINFQGFRFRAVICWPVSSPRLLGTLIIFPAFRLRGHYVTIATLGVGEIVTLDDPQLGLAHAWPDRPDSAIPPLSAVRRPARQRHVGSTRSRSRADRGSRCCSGDCSARTWAARCGRSATTTWRRAATASRSTATRAWPSAWPGFSAGMAGALMAHILLLREPRDLHVAGLAAGADDGDPRRARQHRGRASRRGRCWSACRSCSAPLAEYRMLIYGIALLLLIRFRPAGPDGDA